jgi:hypothetical protein
MHHGILKTKWKKKARAKPMAFCSILKATAKNELGAGREKKRAVRERISGSGGKIWRGKNFFKTYIAHFSLRRGEKLDTKPLHDKGGKNESTKRKEQN